MPPRDTHRLIIKGIPQVSADIPHLHTPHFLLLESRDSIPGLRCTSKHYPGLHVIRTLTDSKPTFPFPDQVGECIGDFASTDNNERLADDENRASSLLTPGAAVPFGAKAPLLSVAYHTAEALSLQSRLVDARAGWSYSAETVTVSMGDSPGGYCALPL